MDLQNKVVVLTGASSGIGFSLTKILPKEGCNLALLARRKNILDELVDSLRGSSQKMFSYKCDVGNNEEVKSVFADIKKQFGKIDIVILNAGTSERTEIKNFSAEKGREIVNANLFGLINCIDQVLPDFMSRRDGMIVGVSSLADVKGFPKSGFYNASKSAATIFLESLRIELKPFKVKVITVRPGFVRTPMTDKNEFYMPLLMDVDKAAKIILNGIKKEKRIIQFPLLIVISTKLLQLLPSRMFEWLAGRPLPPRKDKAT
jgi:short-subunit dehydrogenase